MTPLRNDPRNDGCPVPGPCAVQCPACGTPFAPTGRQVYCSPACRQAAWRARHHRTAPAPAPIATQRRRDITVYECPGCEARYYAEQWCPDCQLPCRRVGIGGLCPHCEEPVAIDDLLAQHQDQSSTPDTKIR